MKQIECFRLEESPYYPGKWMICPVHDNFLLKSTEGSFNVICARLMSLSYAQWLRFCRDCCGAQIIGKNSKYPLPYFNRDDRVQALCRLLNSRANLILWNKENPNWKQHQEELERWKVINNVFNKINP